MRKHSPIMLMALLLAVVLMAACGATESEIAKVNGVATDTQQLASTVAIDDGQIVGFASAVDYLHPDKTTSELWINEIDVATTHQRQGIGKSMLRCLLRHAADIGCSEAWVLTDRDNTPAMALYASLGLKGPPEDAVMFSFPLPPES